MPSSSRSSEPGIEPMSPALQADSLPLSHLGSPGSVFLGNGLYFQHGESLFICLWSIQLVGYMQRILNFRPVSFTLHLPVYM